MSIEVQKVPTLDEAYRETLYGIAGEDSIQELPIADLMEYDDQPYRMYTADQEQEMVASIQHNGVIEPVTVRMLEDGKYQILSGRNRARCASLAGLDKIPCIVRRNISDAQAKLIVNDSNLIRRETLNIRELAYGYKAQAQALSELGIKDALSEMSKRTGENQKKIQRYIHLASLNEILFALVEAGRIPIMAGVELSYLEYAQSGLCLGDYLVKYSDQRLSIKQARDLRKMEENGALETDQLYRFFDKPKKEKPMQVVIGYDELLAAGLDLTDLLPDEIKEMILRLLQKEKGVESVEPEI